MDDSMSEIGATPRAEGERPSRDGGLEWQQALLRFLFMVVVAFIYGVSRVVVGAVVVVQFFWFVFARAPNDRLSEFGESLAVFTYQIVRYLTFATDDRPFPFDLDWPGGATVGNDPAGRASTADT